MKTWLITACSTGCGRALATAALARGQRVVVTARNRADIADVVAPYDAASAISMTLDVTDPGLVQTAVATARDHFGSIDVLVNNAGVSYFGGVEESDPQAVRRLFEINFFGLMAVTNAVLPAMRDAGSGTVVNLASIAGLNGFPGVGYYAASKFAVEGISEALAQEVAPFGIRVLAVEPSGFRTDWARSSGSVAHPISAYDSTPLRRQVDMASDPAAPLAGNPDKAADAIITDVLAGGSRGGGNLHLPLGAASYEATMAKLDRLRAEYVALEEVARSAGDATLPI